MRTPRRWMALAAAIAILTLALLPTTGVAAPRGIKLLNPPSEEYVGDPSIPEYLILNLGGNRFIVGLMQTPSGCVVVIKRVSMLAGVNGASTRLTKTGVASR